MAETSAYDKLIPKDAKTQHGIFTVLQVGDRIYYEIPAVEFGKDFVLVTTLTRTPPLVDMAALP